MTQSVPSAYRVLLVEDNPGDIGLISDMLDSDELAVELTVATDLAQALAELVDGASFDAILLDLGLPDSSGVACLEAILPHRGPATILVLTGMDDERLALECLEAGAEDYINKAEVRPYGLRRAIGYAVARNKEQHQRRRATALQARLAAIVEGSSDAIISCDDDGQVTSWNPGAEAIFGICEESAMGRQISTLVRVPDGQQAEQQSLITLALEGRYGAPRELDRMGSDGSVIALSAVAFPLPDEDGGRLGFGAICRDITQQRDHARELEAQNQMLLERDRQMRALAARLNAVREEERIRISREVHDELGQLLTGIKMDLRWIGKQVADAPPLEARLGEAMELVDRTVTTVQRIATELRPSVLDTLGLAAAIRDEGRRFAERTGMTVSADVVNDPAPDAETATALFRILQEVFANVLRHAQANRLSIRFALEQENWVLRVRDDGVGFDGAVQKRASSLGLLGMAERAALLGGTVTFDTRPGHGAEVLVQIPAGGKARVDG